MHSAFQVTYVSDTDQFTTIQFHDPRDGTHYRVLESERVLVYLLPEAHLDLTNIRAPLVLHLGRTVPLQTAIETGTAWVELSPTPAQPTEAQVQLEDEDERELFEQFKTTLETRRAKRTHAT